MRFQVFFRNLLLRALVEESEEQLEFLFRGASVDDRDEVDELSVVDGAVELAAVLDHEEDLVR